MQRTPGAASSGDDQTARQAAADASALAANARQMVLNRDPALAAMQTSADNAKASVDALALKIDAMKSPTIASGQAKTTNLLALGGSVDLTVTLSRTMPTNTYNVEVIPIGSGLIAGNATIVVKARTTTTVTLTVTSIVAVAASSVVSVIAWG